MVGAPFDLGGWRVSPDADLIERHGIRVRLQPQVMRLLVHLAGRAGEVVTREELLREVWQERFVSDAVISTAIWELREALGDDARRPRFVETVPRRGYRLLLEPRPEPPEGTPAAPNRTSLASRILVLAAATGGLAAVSWLGLGLLRAPSPETVTTLAVLPIENLSGDPSQDYVADGLTEMLITELARLPALRVTSRTSVMLYRAEPRPVPEIGRTLGVETVLEGAVVRSGDRIRLSAQLIDAKLDRHLWAESYERAIGDVISLQNELARTVATEIHLRLPPDDEERLARRPPSSAAIDDYLRGLSQLASDDFHAETAIRAFEAAIARDALFAPAHAGLSMAYSAAAWEYQRAPHEIVERARAAARAALELDPELARAHFALASIHDTYDWNWRQAEVGYRRTLELDPSYAVARRTLAQFLAERGRVEEALAEARAARACDPANASSLRTRGWVEYLAGRRADALASYREASTMAPRAFGLHRELALMLSENEHFEQAIGMLEDLDGQRPDDFHTVALLAMIRARARRTAAARADLDRLLHLAERGTVQPTAVSKVYAWLGDADAAFEWLDRAYEERAPALIQIAVNPQFAPLRGDPRFRALLERIGMPPL